MAKDPKSLQFHEAKKTTRNNLEEVLSTLDECVESGMPDAGARFHNLLLPLIDEAHLAQNWGELEEVIVHARTLEMDVAAWLSARGRTTLSLPWPRKPL